MYRHAIKRTCQAAFSAKLTNIRTPLTAARVVMPALTRSMDTLPLPEGTEEEYTQRWIEFFDDPQLDGWLLRKGINDTRLYDVIPDPKVVISIFHACRRLNEFAITVRVQESVKSTCQRARGAWPYIMQEIEPTMKELGIPAIEEMSYDKPELFTPNVWDM